MARFEHLLLTRFNVPHQQYQRDKRGVNVNDEDWLTHRFNLFESFCLPSVANQSGADFRWLVFFSFDTPDQFRDRIARTQTRCNYTPIYVSSWDDMVPAIQNLPDLNKEFLITSRLDNDDALHKHTLREIQGAFREQEFEFINLATGYILNRANLFSANLPTNPFISLIERVTNHPAKTAWCFDHDSIPPLTSITELHDFNYWVQVIHDRNLVNDWGDSKLHRLQPVKNRLKSFLSRLGLDLSKNGLILPSSKTVADLASLYGWEDRGNANQL